MSCGQEVGICQVCGKAGVPVLRTYFYYDINCECHSPRHFEIVWHCHDCVPKEPKFTELCVKTQELRRAISGDHYIPAFAYTQVRQDGMMSALRRGEPISAPLDGWYWYMGYDGDGIAPVKLKSGRVVEFTISCGKGVGKLVPVSEIICPIPEP